MRPIAGVRVVVLALLCASPVLAEELAVSDLKTFMAKLDAAGERCDVDTLFSNIAELAVISGTGLAQGDTRMYRMNKSQYREMSTRACAVKGDSHAVRTNEKISIDGDQATITTDIAETIVLGGREISAKIRRRATVELIDGKLMLTQLHSNQVE